MRKSILTAFALFIGNVLFAQTLYVKSAGVNLRSGKGTEWNVITNMPHNSEVKVVKKEGDWCQVIFKEHTGYVKAEFLSDKKTDMPTPAPTANKPATQTTSTPESNKSKPSEQAATREKDKAPLEPSEQCFNDNSHLLNFGVGFGNRSYYGSAYSSYNQTPAFSITYEQPIKKRIGRGYLGVGGYVGFQTARYREYYDNYYYYTSHNSYYEDRYNYYMVAARAAYHWDVLNKKKVELYYGALLGVRINTYTHYDSDPAHPYTYNYHEGSSSFAYSGFIGGRYYFLKGLAVYCELGYGVSYATIGLNVKF